MVHRPPKQEMGIKSKKYPYCARCNTGHLRRFSAALIRPLPTRGRCFCFVSSPPLRFALHSEYAVPTCLLSLWLASVSVLSRMLSSFGVFSYWIGLSGGIFLAFVFFSLYPEMAPSLPYSFSLSFQQTTHRIGSRILLTWIVMVLRPDRFMWFKTYLYLSNMEGRASDSPPILVVHPSLICNWWDHAICIEVVYRNDTIYRGCSLNIPSSHINLCWHVRKLWNFLPKPKTACVQ